MKIPIIISLVLFVFSCAEKTNSDIKDKENAIDSISTANSISTKYEGIKTEYGQFVNYVFVSDKKYKLEWGNGHFKFISKDTFEVGSGPPVPPLEWANEKIIELRKGCGSTCWYSIILPLKGGANEKMYMYPIVYDRDRDLIGYYGNDEDTTVLLTVENYLTNERQEIKGEYWYCDSYWDANCVDSISLNDKGLYFRWFTGKYLPEKKQFEKAHEKTFPINL